MGEFQYFIFGTMWQAVEKPFCDLRRLSHVSFGAVLLECCGHCIFHRAQARLFSNFPCMSLWQILWDTSMGPPEARHRAVLIALGGSRLSLRSQQDSPVCHGLNMFERPPRNVYRACSDSHMSFLGAVLFGFDETAFYTVSKQDC